MKKSLTYGLSMIAVVTLLTGCGNKQESNEKKTFTMTCTTEKDTSTEIETETVVTYTFNADQYATGYVTNTTQKFNDKKVYNEYKSAQTETTNDTSEENVVYSLKSDDKNLTLVFTMELKNLYKENATEEEKAALKASKILKTNKDAKAACTLDGIAESELK